MSDIENIDFINQHSIKKLSKSNPITYINAFDSIRILLASQYLSKTNNLTAKCFSFNVPGGRCDTCEGQGVVRVEMQFLADVFVPCDQCNGARYKPQVLEVKYRGRNVDQILNMTVREGLLFFNNSQKVLRRLQVLDEIGRGYLRLGQLATTL